MPFKIERRRDDIWVGTDRDSGRTLGAFIHEGGGWWTACMASGAGRTLWVPAAGDRRRAAVLVARRLFA